MMGKRVLLALGLVIIVGASIFALVQFQDKRTPVARLAEERKVYLVLLADEVVSDGIYPVVEFTTLGDLNECSSRDCTQLIYDGLSEIQQTTVVDFQRNNAESYSVKEYLISAPAFDVRLVNPVENGELLWWMSFSRIGFNSSLDQALVIVEEYAACKNGICEYGTGNFVLLHKVKEEWTIQEYLEIWHMHPT